MSKAQPALLRGLSLSEKCVRQAAAQSAEAIEAKLLVYFNIFVKDYILGIATRKFLVFIFTSKLKCCGSLQ